MSSDTTATTSESLTENQIFENVERAFSQAWLKVQGLPPNSEPSIWASIIPVLIDAAITILQGCVTGEGPFAPKMDAESVHRLATTKSRRARWIVWFRTRRYLIETYGFGAWRSMEGPKIVDAILEAGEESTIRDVQSLIELERMVA